MHARGLVTPHLDEGEVGDVVRVEERRPEGYVERSPHEVAAGRQAKLGVAALGGDAGVFPVAPAHDAVAAIGNLDPPGLVRDPTRIPDVVDPDVESSKTHSSCSFLQSFVDASGPPAEGGPSVPWREPESAVRAVSPPFRFHGSAGPESRGSFGMARPWTGLESETRALGPCW